MQATTTISSVYSSKIIILYMYLQIASTARNINWVWQNWQTLQVCNRKWEFSMKLKHVNISIDSIRAILVDVSLF